MVRQSCAIDHASSLHVLHTIPSTKGIIAPGFVAHAISHSEVATGIVTQAENISAMTPKGSHRIVEN